MLQKKNLGILGYSFLVVFAIALSGCAAGMPHMHPIEVDIQSNEAYTAILFGRIKVHASSGYLRGQFLQINALRKDTPPSPTNFISIKEDVQDEIKTLNSVDRFFALEVIPGSYEIKFIDLSNVMVSNIFVFFPKQHDYAKPQYLFPVEPNSLTYLGVIDIAVESSFPRNPIPGTSYPYKYTVRIDNNLATDEAFFKARFPSIYQKYQSNKKIAF